MLISTLGGGLARQLRQAGLPSNSGFSGAYDLGAASSSIATVFARFLRSAGERHLVMCHPGHSDALLAARDTMTTAREAELSFLESEAWPKLLAEAGMVIGPLRQVA